MTTFIESLNTGNRLPNYSKEAIQVYQDEYTTDESINRGWREAILNDQWLISKIEELSSYILDDNLDLSVSARWESCYSSVQSNSALWEQLSTEVKALTYPNLKAQHDFIPSWSNGQKKLLEGFGTVLSDSKTLTSNEYIVSDRFLPTTKVCNRVIDACIEPQRTYQDITYSAIEGQFAVWASDKTIKGANMDMTKEALWHQLFHVKTNGLLDDESGSVVTKIGQNDLTQLVFDGGYTRPITVTPKQYYNFHGWTYSINDCGGGYTPSIDGDSNTIQIGSASNSFEDNIHWDGNYIANILGDAKSITYKVDPPRNSSSLALGNNIILSDNFGSRPMLPAGTSLSAVNNYYGMNVDIIKQESTVLDNKSELPFKLLQWKIDDVSQGSSSIIERTISNNGFTIEAIYGHDLFTSFDPSYFTVKELKSGSAVTSGVAMSIYDSATRFTDNKYVTLAAKASLPSQKNFLQWTFSDTYGNYYGYKDLKWTAVTYGNGLFVATSNNIASDGNGINAAMWSDDNGSTWHLANTSNCSEDAIRWYGVTYANSKFVAVQQYYGTAPENRTMPAMYSTDGKTWNRGNCSTFFVGNWYDVCYGNGKYIAVGAREDAEEPWNHGINFATIMTSIDGITWTKTYDSSTALYSICLNPVTNTFIAVGGDTIQRSTDGGTTWSSFTKTGNWKKVCYGNGILIAVSLGKTGDNGQRIIRSTDDGLTWSYSSTTFDDTLYFHGATYGNGTFVITAPGGYSQYRILTSTDGLTWTTHITSDSHYLRSVTFGNNTFIAVSSGASDVNDDGNTLETKAYRVFKSIDNGTTWTNELAAIKRDTTPDWYNIINFPVIDVAATSIHRLSVSEVPKKFKLQFNTNSETLGLVCADAELLDFEPLSGKTAYVLKDTNAPAMYLKVLNSATTNFEKWTTLNTEYATYNNSTANPLVIDCIADGIFTANFVAKPTWTVTYNIDNSLLTGTNPQTVIDGGTASVVYASPNSSYKWQGWTLDSGTVDSFNANDQNLTLTNVRSNVTVTAHSIESSKYTVTFKTSPVDITCTFSQNNVVVSAGGSVSNVTITGIDSTYIFASWQVASGSCTISASSNSVTVSNITSDVIIEAVLAVSVISFCSETVNKPFIYNAQPITTDPILSNGSSFTTFNASTSNRTALETKYASIQSLYTNLPNAIITELTVLPWFGWNTGTIVNLLDEGQWVGVCNSMTKVAICTGVNGLTQKWTYLKLPTKIWTGALRTSKVITASTPTVISLSSDSYVQQLHIKGNGYSLDTAPGSAGPNTQGYVNGWGGFKIICMKYIPA